MPNKAMQEFVISMLREKLPATYFYHNYEHTLDVLANVERIGKQEGITEKDMQLLKAAALWHDMGYINSYKGHEHESCVLAKTHLPHFGFTENDIVLICGMIMATRVPQLPHNLLEEIIADADLEYLGTSKAPQMAHQLFKELQVLNPELSETDWNKKQISFLRSHQYFTAYCRKINEPQKQAYLAQLEKLVQEEK